MLSGLSGLSGHLRRLQKVCGFLPTLLLCLGMNLAVNLAVNLMLGWPAAHADTLDDIRTRGVLRVGVKRDVPQWGWLNTGNNRIEGIEPDLAAELGRRLGVRVELLGLLTADRIAALHERRVDVLIATLSDTPERARQLHLVPPHYYASGVNILARKDQHFRQWGDLRNRRVCGRRGAFYNRAITVDYGADIVQLYGNTLAQAALRDGRCAALLHDDTALQALLLQAGWKDSFEMPLPTLYTTPWSVALHKDEQRGRLAQAVSDAIADWHRQGLIVQLESRWGAGPAPFARAMHQRWQSGQCGSHVSATTPPECL